MASVADREYKFAGARGLRAVDGAGAGACNMCLPPLRPASVTVPAAIRGSLQADVIGTGSSQTWDLAAMSNRSGDLRRLQCTHRRHREGAHT